MGWRFAVLGPVRAWQVGTHGQVGTQGQVGTHGRGDAEGGGEAELDLGSPQQCAMLAALLLRAGRAVSIEDLVDALWEVEPPARAVGMLRTYASRLRQRLEIDRSRPEILVSAGTGYVLRVPAESVDAFVFEERVASAANARSQGDPARARTLLLEATELWGGSPLAGLPGPYAAAQRDRLAERRLSALQSRLELDLELGRHADAVAELAALADDHPLREPLRALLMLALHRCGRQAEALEVFARTRRLLAAELGADPSAELRDLHQRILRSDPGLHLAPAAGSVRTIQPRAAEPKIAQLPADTADFTGRDRLVGQLCHALAAGAERAKTAGRAPVIAAVAGQGGVGKTTLAVHVAHAVRDAYPDGQLYVDLGGASRHPAEPAAVLREFLQALGLPEVAIPEGVAERSALYRSRLADRRVLVLLDNARDLAQIRALLPGGAGCGVLVTGRAKLTGLPADRRVDLEVLEEDEALALFTGIVGAERVDAEPAAARDAIRRCGYLPLAVRIVAARLAARPHWTIASLVARLSDERRRLSELCLGTLGVAATFQLGYDQLDEDQARVFRLLALPSTTAISVEASAALLGLDPYRTEDLAESLVDLGLLDSPAPGRYRYHDLLWLFARQHSERADGPEEQRAALARLLDFLLATQCNVLEMLRPGDPVRRELIATTAPGLAFGGPAAARAWTFRELTELLALVRQVAEDPMGPLSAAADLLLALDPLLEDGYHWHAVEPAAEAVLAEALRRGDDRGEARARYALGQVLTHTSRLAGGREHVERAIVLCEAVGEEVLLAEVHNLLSHVAFYERNHDESFRYLRQALLIDQRLGNRLGEAERTTNLAHVHMARGDLPSALAAAERGLELCRAVGYHPGEAYALYTLGLGLREVGRVEEAIARFDDGLALCWSQGLRARESYTLQRIAESYLELGRAPDALAAAERALAVGREIGEEFQQGRALTVLGRAAAGLGRAGRARECWDAALEIFVRLDVAEADDVRALLATLTASPGQSQSRALKTR